jgi:antitoxin (DNA-binding transcriptional repressor) of toxin-antitoxin stability system
MASAGSHQAAKAIGLIGSVYQWSGRPNSWMKACTPTECRKPSPALSCAKESRISTPYVRADREVGPCSGGFGLAQKPSANPPAVPAADWSPARGARPRLDDHAHVRHSCLTMAATATIRELRNDFPRIKKLVDVEGEVIVTDKGTPRYRLTSFTPPRKKKPTPKDYLGRMARHQPRAMTRRVSRSLHEENRGDR